MTTVSLSEKAQILAELQAKINELHCQSSELGQEMLYEHERYAKAMTRMNNSQKAILNSVIEIQDIMTSLCWAN